MNLIDKSKLLEGLKKLKHNLSASPIVVIEDVESLVESLEVEEMDFEKEVSSWWDKHYADAKGYKFGSLNGHYLQNITVINLAKHFFELGLKAKGE